MTYGRVEPIFRGETVVCLGTGPSLTEDDVAYCRGRARVIAIKDAIQWAPWADVSYAAGLDGSRWWARQGATMGTFRGLSYTLDPNGAAYGAQVLQQTGFDGLEADPTGLRTGKNSGYQAIGIAAHLGASKIVLLGYDMQRDPVKGDHFFGAHWHGRQPPFLDFRPLFETLIAPLKALGIQILNATRRTALTCFQTCSLVEALA